MLVKIKRKILAQSSKKPVASQPETGMMGRSQPAMSERLAYIEQIKRDMAVLKEDPIYFEVPGRRFYERRIEAYRATIRQMDSSSVGASDGKKPTIRSIPRVWVRLVRRKR